MNRSRCIVFAIVTLCYLLFTAIAPGECAMPALHLQTTDQVRVTRREHLGGKVNAHNRHRHGCQAGHHLRRACPSIDFPRAFTCSRPIRG